jgi:hypothetical protein
MQRKTFKGTSHLKIIVAVLLTVILPLISMQTNQALTAGDYMYEVTDGLATITGYVGAGGDVVVPATLDGFQVVAINRYAFYNNRSMTSISIPGNITSIGSGAFNRCMALSAIQVDEANPAYMSRDGVLFDATGVTLIQYPIGRTDTTYTIPSGVNTIGEIAFNYCQTITSIVIPNGVTGIGSAAFSDCSNLASVTLPGSITSIGYRAFLNCYNLASVTLLDGITSLGTRTFDGCSKLNEITIPGSITSIGEQVFYGCTSLTSISLPEGLTSIGYGAFYECQSLTGITLPSSITSIGVAAFSYCRNLSGILLPEGLTSISSNLFYQCSSLTSITLPSSITSIGTSAFSGCKNLSGILLPEGLTSISNNLFYQCSSLSSITLPGSVTSIGDAAFFNCSSLASISISSGVTSIGDNAFAFCTSLAAINVDSGNLTYMSLDGVLFDKNGATLLKYPAGKPDASYVIPDTVTTIGPIGFENSNLVHIHIPGSVTVIGSSAFRWCYSLSDISIPDSVTSIGNNAFQHCTALTSIILPGSITGINYGTFMYCISLNSVTIPDSVTSIGDRAFDNCSSLKSIFIPDSVTSIGAYAFTLTGLESIILPDKITSINACTFVACGFLKNVTIPAKVTRIEWSAFANCSVLTNLTFLGITPPTTAAEWIKNTPLYLRGHAYYGSSFPAPNSVFNGLKMGTYIPEDYYYTVTDGKATITGYHGTGGDVTIPATLGGCPVTGIGDNAFAGCIELTSLTVPESVTDIGSSPFAECWYMTDITFLGLTPPVTATDWITEANYDLRGHAYYGASFPAPGSSLNGLIMGPCIPEDYYYTIKDGQATITRYTGMSLDIVTPETLGGCPVVAIGNGRWPVYGQIVNSVEIRDGMTRINENAFAGNTALTRITIPDSVTFIGDSAFSSCSALTSITIPGSVPVIAKSTFASCSALTHIILMEGVTHIGDNAFISCTALTNLSIPDSLAHIGNTAFYGCTSLTGITLPQGVASLGQFAFLLCSSLTEIGVDADSPHYKSLDGVLLNKAGTLMVQYPVGRTDTSYTIPAAVTAIGNGAFATCTTLANIMIPESVTLIGDGAFYGCTALSDIVLPSGLTCLGDYAFEECTALTSLTLPSGVTRIGEYTFADCIALTDLNILGNVTSIGDWAFAWCESLTGIALPDSVTSLGTCTFRGCIALTRIVIPSGVTSIGDRAFSWCESLADITFLCLTPPTIVDSSEWILETSPELLGHAWFGAGFPAPGGTFNGLTMGDYIAQPINDISPSSPLILYTRGNEVTQVFAATYENHGLVASATLTVDADAPLALDTTHFSRTLSLTTGSHTIILTIRDEAGNTATQTWFVTVIQDTKAPILAGIDKKMKIISGNPIPVSITDDLSGVDWDSLKVTINRLDVTDSMIMTADGFIIPGSMFNKGDYTLFISVCDNVGNVTEVKYEYKVK